MLLVYLQSVGGKVTTTLGAGGEGFSLGGSSVVVLDVGVFAGSLDLSIVYEAGGGVGCNLGTRNEGGIIGWLYRLREAFRGR